jgi:AhpD family alkylhydroperoxidase
MSTQKKSTRDSSENTAYANLIKQQRKEVVNLAVSQLNGCKYCQAAHTATGKMNGFTDDQIIELRKEKQGIAKPMF